jgi:hypothetical protein
MEEQTTLDNLVGLSVLNILDKSGYEVWFSKIYSLSKYSITW